MIAPSFRQLDIYREQAVVAVKVLTARSETFDPASGIQRVMQATLALMTNEVAQILLRFVSIYLQRTWNRKIKGESVIVLQCLRG